MVQDGKKIAEGEWDADTTEAEAYLRSVKESQAELDALGHRAQPAVSSSSSQRDDDSRDAGHRQQAAPSPVKSQPAAAAAPASDDVGGGADNMPALELIDSDLNELD